MDAKRVAHKLDIDHRILYYQNKFKEGVIDNFVACLHRAGGQGRMVDHGRIDFRSAQIKDERRSTGFKFGDSACFGFGQTTNGNELTLGRNGGPVFLQRGVLFGVWVFSVFEKAFHVLLQRGHGFIAGFGKGT